MYLPVLWLLVVCSCSMKPKEFYIYFERSGGFAGIGQSMEISSDTLSAEVRDHLSHLIDASEFFEIKEESGANLPDQFNYIITIRSGRSERTIETGDGSMPEKLRPLTEYLTKLLREKQ